MSKVPSLASPLDDGPTPPPLIAHILNLNKESRKKKPLPSSHEPDSIITKKRRAFASNIAKLASEEDVGRREVQWFRVLTEHYDDQGTAGADRRKSSGILIEIFEFYCNLFPESKKLNNNSLPLAIKLRARTALSFGELLGILYPVFCFHLHYLLYIHYTDTCCNVCSPPDPPPSKLFFAPPL
jgi:hypothetical protein